MAALPICYCLLGLSLPCYKSIKNLKNILGKFRTEKLINKTSVQEV